MLVFPQAIYAATLYMSPSSGSYGVGEPFSVTVYVGNASNAINAASGQLSFDNEHLKITGVSYSSSIFKIWAEEPGFSNVAGTIHFSGGLPSPGFTGNGGSVFRINFQPIKEGSAAVNFLSGAVLANDGNGTDVLTGSSGGTFSIVPAKEKPVIEQPKNQTPVTKPVSAVIDKSISVPLITDWPDTLEQNDTLTVHGVGIPNGKLIVYFQKGSEEAVPQEVTAGPEGRFTATYGDYVKAGLYHVSVKNETTTGALSNSSDVVTIQVIVPYYIRIGSHLITYVSIILGLIALVLILIIIGLSILLLLRKWRNKRMKDLTRVEKSVHEDFDQMREDLHKSMKKLFQVKSYVEKDKEVEIAEDKLEEEINMLEGDLEKDIEDIKKD